MNSSSKRSSRKRRTRASISGGLSFTASSVVSVRAIAPSSAMYNSPSGVASISPLDFRLVDREHPEIADEIVDLVVRHLCAEVLRSHFFDEMRFVENDRGVIRQDR